MPLGSSSATNSPAVPSRYRRYTPVRPEMVHIGHHLNEAAGKIEAGQYIESQLLLMFATNTIFDCFLQ